MNNATKAVIKYADQVAWCVVSAIATSAGTTLWHTVLKPRQTRFQLDLEWTESRAAALSFMCEQKRGHPQILQIVLWRG